MFPTQIEELIMGIPALSPHFQLHLTREGRMDQLAVHVERRPGVTEAAAADAGMTLASLVKNTQSASPSRLGHGPGVHRAVRGKMRRVVDHRPR